MKDQRIEASLPEAWTQPRTKARLHLLRAHSACKAVVLRRKPSKRVHVISWDTRTDRLEHGSWFNGRIYAERCDLSFDGRWMVYLAMGSKGETWNGICEVPWLRSIVHVPNMGTMAGGGYFPEARKLCSNDHLMQDRTLSEFSKNRQLPFQIQRLDSGGEAFPILAHRLERDGWRRCGDVGKSMEISLKHSSYSVYIENDPGWKWQPSEKHPVLRMYYRGYLVGGYTFEFQIEGSDLLDPRVDWATWDSKGDLLLAREGMIQRFTLQDLERGTPSFSCDLNQITA